MEPTEDQRRHYDLQIGVLQTTVTNIKERLEETIQERRDQHQAIIERLDVKINGRIDGQATLLQQHALAISTLLLEFKHMKETHQQMTLPAPAPGTKTSVSNTESGDAIPLTRRDLGVAVATTISLGTVVGLIFKFWPVFQKLFKE